MVTSDQPPAILVVGAANTGRSPIATAMLRQFLQQRGLMWSVESAGIIGYDGDPPDIEARNVMLVSFSLDISDHCARSLDSAMIEAATMLITIDSGIANALTAQYPAAAARTITLGALAGRQRDIPDPYRMQVGAWMTYAREIERLLTSGIERLIALVEALHTRPASEQTSPADLLAAHEQTERATLPPEAQTTTTATTDIEEPAPAPAPPVSSPAPPPESRTTAIERAERLLALMRDMPGLVGWEHARTQLAEEIKAASLPLQPGDLVESYAALLQALLGLSATTPTAAQLTLLSQAIGTMRTPIDQHELSRLSAAISGWATLA